MKKLFKVKVKTTFVMYADTPENVATGLRQAFNKVNALLGTDAVVDFDQKTLEVENIVKPENEEV